MTQLNLDPSTAKKDSAVPMFSPILRLISSHDNSRETQFKEGQVYQRLSRLAGSFGICLQPLSQLMQVELTEQQGGKLQANPRLFPQLPF